MLNACFNHITVSPDTSILRHIEATVIINEAVCTSLLGVRFFKSTVDVLRYKLYEF